MGKIEKIEKREFFKLVKKQVDSKFKRELLNINCITEDNIYKLDSIIKSNNIIDIIKNDLINKKEREINNNKVVYFKTKIKTSVKCAIRSGKSDYKKAVPHVFSGDFDMNYSFNVRAINIDKKVNMGYYGQFSKKHANLKDTLSSKELLKEDLNKKANSISDKIELLKSMGNTHEDIMIELENFLTNYVKEVIKGKLEKSIRDKNIEYKKFRANKISELLK